jgi:MoxR-like ATPase
MKPATDLPEFRGDRTDFYDADASVAEIVNLAILLERPLLVEGEPGCSVRSGVSAP